MIVGVTTQIAETDCFGELPADYLMTDFLSFLSIADI
jgi:hypothetical protein